MVFESHITIEPVQNERYAEFEKLCAPFNFKVAHFLMMKDRRWTEERSNRDSFCTGHSNSYQELLEKTETLAALLHHNGFKVWRFKIEQTLLDVRDPFFIQISNKAAV